jgi:hypothetical protein
VSRIPVKMHAPPFGPFDLQETTGIPLQETTGIQQTNAMLLSNGFVPGGCLAASPVRILVVDDYEPFRRVVCSLLGERPELQIGGEVSDGLEAVQKAEECDRT